MGGGGGGVTVVPSVSFAVLKNNTALNGRVLSLYGPGDQRLRTAHKDCTELHSSLRSQYSKTHSPLLSIKKTPREKMHFSGRFQNAFPSVITNIQEQSPE